MATPNTRPELILAALLYLLTAYRRRPCPGLAACIARHFEYLARHPKADRVVCDVAAASSVEWEAAAREAPVTVVRGAGFPGFALH
jgi:hypothetical protein